MNCTLGVEGDNTCDLLNVDKQNKEIHGEVEWVVPVMRGFITSANRFLWGALTA